MTRLILASISPRRKVLMECMGLMFDVIPSTFDEYLDEDRSPRDVCIELGYGKADDVARKHPDAYTIGGDLIVVVDDKQLAKPADAAEAKEMLRLISGRTHQAFGSVVLVSPAHGVRDADAAEVHIEVAEIPESVMDAYIATGDPYDKAGGYARRHPLIAPYFTVHGDTHVLTGLSTKQLRALLEKHGIEVPNDEVKTNELFEKSSFADLRVIV